MRLLALRSLAAKLVLPHLGNVRETSSEKAQRLLGWSPRPLEDAVMASAESLRRLGLASA